MMSKLMRMVSQSNSLAIGGERLVNGRNALNKEEEFYEVSYLRKELFR